MAISILCPGCTVQLGLPDEAAGATVACPRCGTTMRVPRPAFPPPPPPPPREEQKPRPRRLERDEEPDDDDEPERPRKKRSSDDRPKRKKKKDDDKSGIWVGVAVGAGVVFATIIAAVFLAQEPEKKATSETPSTVTIVPYGANPDGSINNPKGGPAPGPVPGPIPGPGPVAGSPAVTRPSLPPGWVVFKHPEEGFSCYVPAPAVLDRNSERSLRLRQPFQPGEERSSDYIVAPTADQPLGCTMTVSVSGPVKPPRPFDLMARPADTPDIKVTEFQIVTWGGRPASEGAGEHTIRFNGNDSPPKVVYRIGRVQDIPERLYIFNLQREGRMPTPAERAAFFDSFVPGK